MCLVWLSWTLHCNFELLLLSSIKKLWMACWFYAHVEKVRECWFLLHTLVCENLVTSWLHRCLLIVWYFCLKVSNDIENWKLKYTFDVLKKSQIRVHKHPSSKTCCTVDYLIRLLQVLKWLQYWVGFRWAKICWWFALNISLVRGRWKRWKQSEDLGLLLRSANSVS